VSTLPDDVISLEVHIPDDIYSEHIDPSELRAGWNSSHGYSECVDTGDAWIDRGTSLLLFVPSAILPKFQNVLLNPAHPDAGLVSVNEEDFSLDPRLFRFS
jgi:RES domain-containing protein